jgi:hypothetical protein
LNGCTEIGGSDRSPERTSKSKEDGRSVCESKNDGFSGFERYEK